MRLPIVLAVLAISSCGGGELPPLGEARVTLDTDLPIPRLANRLRVDVYTSDGSRWYASYDFVRLDPSEWPLSFGVHLPSPESPARSVLLRFRAFRAEVVRDYRGERFYTRPAPGDPSEPFLVPESEDGGPRLVIDGRDVTPRTEPEPTAAVDRLVLVNLEPERVREVSVTLRGACAGTMADLAGARTCVDESGKLVSAATLDPPIVKSRAGTFGAAQKCTRPPRQESGLFDEEICVPGGAFLFGGRTDTADVGVYAARPERVVIEPPFLLDKWEVTVGRFRAALAEGLRTDTDWVFANDDTLDVVEGAPILRACTFSTTPRGRERMPLNCVNHAVAVDFCHFQGGELMSETQYELAVSRDLEHARFPWGDELPECDTAIFARQLPKSSTTPTRMCNARGVGPANEDDPSADVAPTGVMNLGGNVCELLFDELHSLSSNCWMSLSPLSPRCDPPKRARSVVRGGSWRKYVDGLRVERREYLPVNAFGSEYGFRCARRGR